MFSCEFCEISKSSFFTERLLTSASVYIYSYSCYNTNPIDERQEELNQNNRALEAVYTTVFGKEQQYVLGLPSALIRLYTHSNQKIFFKKSFSQVTMRLLT